MRSAQLLVHVVIAYIFTLSSNGEIMGRDWWSELKRNAVDSGKWCLEFWMRADQNLEHPGSSLITIDYLKIEHRYINLNKEYFHKLILTKKEFCKFPLFEQCQHNI